ncbi:class I SAM-dependent methyltransferase [Candidatus Comchoanobacter bicostacola]|uniref:Class I SAM-dependent methyltransferase n=1 Tax=Candidatus Comchoanobacter bicostacola TaxID=2919598 RepID=A0ABY5DKZ8_9GAMM|nr:class I SAM-dependent methyltransferase [Candidatus Comchoanobacter bicostacola]UTC24475.1 class I SAM-dependent methyltransferase [Candidatus Comchoanobacter bicostacola]
MNITATPKYQTLKQEIEQSNSTPKELTLHLKDPHHEVVLDNCTFKLDFKKAKWRSMTMNTDHPLLRAIGRDDHILDAFGGLGKDGWIIANQAKQVTTCEHQIVLFSILNQAAQHHSLTNWKILHQDGHKLFDQNFDVIYLDPMFEHTNTAKPKIEMQVIRLLAHMLPETDWKKAYQCAKKRLIIKQNYKSPILGCLPKPSYQVTNGKKSRYDVYIKP